MTNFKLSENPDREAKRIFESPGIDPMDFGPPDKLRHQVLAKVADEQYESAIEQLRNFFATKSPYPTFNLRIERYINHSIDLIYAIKAKRSFPGITQLTRAKQQELRDRFRDHFNELIQVLKKMEKIERDLKLEDARSTIYVVKALWVAAMVVALIWFFIEVYRGLAVTSFLVVKDTFVTWIDAFLDYIGM